MLKEEPTREKFEGFSRHKPELILGKYMNDYMQSNLTYQRGIST